MDARATTTTSRSKKGRWRRRSGPESLFVALGVIALSVAFPSSASAGTLGGEPPDFPNSGDGPTFTAVAGLNTVDGALGPTPADNQDRFDVVIPSDLEVTNVSYVGPSGPHSLIGCGLTGTNDLDQEFDPSQSPCVLSYILATDFSPTAQPWTVTINAVAVNDAPVAVDDVYSTSEDVPVVAAAPGLLGNDTDADGDALTAALVSGPAYGALAWNANGSFSYTPNPNFAGTDSFTYRAADPSGAVDEATVTITVSAVNDAPTVTATFGACFSDTSATVSLALSDAEIPANQLTASASDDSASINTRIYGSGSTRILHVDTTGTHALSGTVTVTITDPQGAATALVIRVIRGTHNADTLTAPLHTQTIVLGRNGNDTITASNQSDLVCAGAGDDTINGGAGKDALYGSAGRDTLRGGGNEDLLSGGDDADRLFGDNGNDALFGDNGNDDLTGGAGADAFVGGPGTDRNLDYNAPQGDTQY